MRAHHVEVWYDEFSISVGDSLRQAIDRGLAQSNFGIVVVSPYFFQKRWTQWELNGLVTREMSEGRPLVLPIWHQISHDEIIQFSPPLADVYALSSARGIDIVVSELLKTLRPDESPLIIARDFLIEKGLTPPVVSDVWWLDIVELKESRFNHGYFGPNEKWIFPLPYFIETSSKERGLNIAWTALQLDWAFDGEERRLCQLTRPEIVHDFLRTWPGFVEFCRENPDMLALYAPQLTIPGLDEGFADVFDSLLDPTRENAYQPLGYGPPDTIDGNEPLCGELIAWRHPTFGNYSAGEIARGFVGIHRYNCTRRLYTSFECLAWLLCNESDWMPSDLRNYLLEGFRQHTIEWARDISDSKNAISEIILDARRSKFKLTRTVRSDIEALVAQALHNLGITESSHVISERFIAGGFIEAYFDEQEKWKRMKRRKH